jgi:hypothetical protein
MMEEQFELPLPEGEDNTLYFEDLTLTADSVLAGNIGLYKNVFIVGVTDNGFCYRASNGDALFWSYALEKARAYIMNNMDN